MTGANPGAVADAEVIKASVPNSSPVLASFDKVLETIGVFATLPKVRPTLPSVRPD